MQAVRLRLKRYQTHRLGTFHLHLERIVALIRINNRIFREAVVDTGAPLSAFPEEEWRSFEQAIEWLTEADDVTIPQWCREFAGVGGGVIRCRIGVVSMEVLSIKKDRIGPERVGPSRLAAMFAFDGGRMKEILLGLGGGMFARRRFEFVYDRESVVLRQAR